MARIRTVKPGLFRHHSLFEAERRSGLPLRLAFIGLFTACDRSGRFKWRPEELKLDCLPFDSVDFSRVLDALETCGQIVSYCDDHGEIYGYIPTWEKHQVINNRERDSELPDPKTCKILTREARVTDASVSPLVHDEVEGKGREVEVE